MKRLARMDYAYAVGRVHALEKYLVAKSSFIEAADERNLSSALKIIFGEGQYHQEKIEVQDSRHLDAFLEKETSVLTDLIARIIWEPEIEKIILGADRPDDGLVLSRKWGLSFITEYLRHKIDLGNLKVFCRAKYLGLSIERLEKAMQKGGFLDEKLLPESFELSCEEVGEKLLATPYHAAWVLGTDELIQKETFLVLEREFEDFLMFFLRKAKYIVFGPEPVFAYAEGKKRELQLFRLLGVGKLNGIPPEMLKLRISETYV